MSLIELRLLGILALVAGCLFGWQHFTAKLKAEGRAQCEAAHAQADAAEKTRREAAKAENERETNRLVTLDRDRAVALAVAAAGLRNAGAVAIGRLEHPGAPAGSAPAPAASSVPALVSGEVEERLRALAAAADERGTAGDACVRAYESLTP